ncbi:MAG: TfoX/Sxy family protein [Gammaproteobacteria bacterium]|nr:TfoX/Sxy family protein [Gammaproteobacteria bacterium]MDH4255043.1 TfoX/Sxy family protein [Gammaproteobacteria bacterium]MDH5310957.1 TfoX/Sxy family protein [Gammaproteobacteria bacterium]
MASDLEFVRYVVDQIDASCAMSYRMMFGEYALYSNGKVVALICDNQLFVKPTEAGRAYIGDPTEAPPYPGAKLSFLIGDELEDREWLTRLVVLTEQALPAPKPKKKKARRKKTSGG